MADGNVLSERYVRLFRSGHDQAVQIPREFELPGDGAIMRQDGQRLIIEPINRTSLSDLLKTWEPLDEDFPDIEDLPPDPVEL